MKKLAVVSLSMSLASVVWFGCSSTNVVSNGTPEGGTGADTGTPGDDSGGGSDGGGTDAPTDTKKTIDPPSGPFFDLTYGTCPNLVACGGDPKGRWNVSGGCVADTVFSQATAACPGIVISNVKFQARGYVEVDAVTSVRSTEVKLTADFNVPQACKTAVGGTCAAISSAIQAAAGIDKATCTDDAGGGCDCAVEDTQLESSSAGYLVTGNDLTTTGSPAQTFAFCVAAPKVSYQETTGGNPRPYVIEMTK